MVCAGVSVSRFSTEANASLSFRVKDGPATSLITRSLTADQCEDLAKALIDAASDLRQAALATRQAPLETEVAA